MANEVSIGSMGRRVQIQRSVANGRGMHAALNPQKNKEKVNRKGTAEVEIHAPTAVAAMEFKEQLQPTVSANHLVYHLLRMWFV